MTQQNQNIPKNILGLPENLISKYPESEEFIVQLREYCRDNHCGMGSLEYLIQCGVRYPSFIELSEVAASMPSPLSPEAELEMNEILDGDPSESGWPDYFQLKEDIEKFLIKYKDDLSRMLELDEHYVEENIRIRQEQAKVLYMRNMGTEYNCDWLK